MMIEPTETENKETLEEFAKAMIAIDEKINEDYDKEEGIICTLRL